MEAGKAGKGAGAGAVDAFSCGRVLGIFLGRGLGSATTGAGFGKETRSFAGLVLGTQRRRTTKV